MTDLHWMLLGTYVLAASMFYCSERWHEKALADARKTSYVDPRWQSFLCGVIWPIVAVLMLIGTWYDFLTNTNKT